jgi:Preprotein translocase subunit SecD
MMEEKKDKPIYMDYKVIILVLALLISIIFIGPSYSADEGFHTRVKFGLDIEGGSWIQLRLNGAVAQVNANPEQIVTQLTKSDFPNGIEITRSNSYENGTAVVAFRATDPVNKTRLEYLFGNDVYIRANGTASDVTITASQISFIISYLSTVYDTEVIPAENSGAIEYEIRTLTTEEELDAYMKAVGGSILRDSSGNALYRNGTTKETMKTTIDVLNSKLGNGLGMKDLPIRAVGDEYILIDFAGVELSEARDLVSTPGKFEIRLQTTGDESIHVLYGNSIESVRVVSQDPRTGMYYVPFSLNQEGATALRQAAISTGATTNPNAHALIMLLDDEVVYSAPLSPDAASQLNTYPIYLWQATTGSEADAKDLQIHLRSGALPVNVEIYGSGQVDASLGQGFLKGAIIAGIFAMIAVAGVVYNRYRRPEIAIPMILTSFSEVVLLIGFTTLPLIRQELDIAAIAGIIAVIGTGIDHLVIITEEVVHEGKTPSDKVYTARIGKAFMIIFGAAATTVIAMSPLLLLGFGALKGFAITTIAGVFIGVLIARPAYAAILRYILTKRGIENEKLSN